MMNDEICNYQTTALQQREQRARRGGDTALTCAAEGGHTECVRLLLENGAEKDGKNMVHI